METLELEKTEVVIKDNRYGVQPIIERLRIERAGAVNITMTNPTNQIQGGTPMDGRVLTCSFMWKGEVHYLTQQTMEYKKYVHSFQKIELNPSPHIIVFDNMTRSYAFEYDINPNTRTEMDINLGKRAEFFRNHPECMWNGSSDKGSRYNNDKDSPAPRFNVILESLESSKQTETEDRWTRAFNLVQDMSYDDMTRLMWFLGENPENRVAFTEKKMRSYLMNPDKGIVFKKLKDSMGNEIADTIDNKSNLTKTLEFADSGNKGQNDMLINLLRAINKNVITIQSINGVATYMLNNTAIASDIRNLQVYFMENKTTYELYILANLKPVAAPAEVEVITPSDKNFNELVEKANDLKAKGYIHNNMKLSKENEDEIVEMVKEASEAYSLYAMRFPTCVTFKDVLNNIDPDKKTVNLTKNINKNRKEKFKDIQKILDRAILQPSKTTKG